jgi:hypothetical protein
MMLAAAPAELFPVRVAAIASARDARRAASEAVANRKDDSNIAELMKAFYDAVDAECSALGIKFDRGGR